MSKATKGSTAKMTTEATATPHSPTDAQQDRGDVTTATESVAVRAYAIWEAEGRPEGRAQDHWLRAEQELLTAGESQSS